MAAKNTKTVSIGFRISPDVDTRVETLRVHLEKRISGCELSKSQVYRMALLKGLELLEKEEGLEG